MSYEMLKTQDVVLKFRFIHNPKNTQYTVKDEQRK